MANTIQIKRGNGVPTSLADGELAYSKSKQDLYIGHENVVNSLLGDKLEKLDLLDYVYPIGSIYMSTENVCPASFLGGTWSKIQDTFLLAGGSSYTEGRSGGSPTHALSVNELPSHNHTGSTGSTGSHTHTVTTESAGAHYHTLDREYVYYSGSGWSRESSGSSYSYASGYTNTTGAHTHSLTIASSGSHSHTVTIDSIGGGQPSQQCRLIQSSICGKESRIFPSTVKTSYTFTAPIRLGLG